MTLFLVLLTSLALAGSLPVDPPPPSPESGASVPGEAFDELGCGCEATVRGGYLCVALRSFDDNSWTHDDSAAFVADAREFAAKLETALEGFSGDYHLALQGWADLRKISNHRLWGEAHPDCRGGRPPGDKVENRDLAFLRACELRRVLQVELRQEIELLDSVDFGEEVWRSKVKGTPSGERYKAAVLFIVLPESEVCI